MTGDFYYCEWHQVIPEDATYEVDVRPERHCSPCAEEGIDQIVTLIPDDEVDLSIFDYLTP